MAWLVVVGWGIRRFKSTFCDFFDDEAGVEEGPILMEKVFRFGREMFYTGRVGLARGEHVPVGEAGAGFGGVRDFFEEKCGGLFVHILEDVAEVEGVEFFGAEGFFEWGFDDGESVFLESATNLIVRFALEGEGEDFAVCAGEDPVEIGVLRRVKGGESIFCSVQDAVGNGAFDVVKKGGVTSKAAHDEAGEEGFEDEAPAAVVPDVVVEVFSLGLCLGLEELGDALFVVGEGNDAGAEEVEVALELPGGSEDGFEKVGVIEVEVGVLAEFDTLDLGRVHFDCGDVRGTGCEECEGVVACGADREAIAVFGEEGFDEDVGVFPALTVTDLGEVGARLDFGFHGGLG